MIGHYLSGYFGTVHKGGTSNHEDRGDRKKVQ